MGKIQGHEGFCKIVLLFFTKIQNYMEEIKYFRSSTMSLPQIDRQIFQSEEGCPKTICSLSRMHLLQPQEHDQRELGELIAQKYHNWG